MFVIFRPVCLKLFGPYMKNVKVKTLFFLISWLASKFGLMRVFVLHYNAVNSFSKVT